MPEIVLRDFLPGYVSSSQYIWEINLKKLSIIVESKNTVRIYYAYVCEVITYVSGAFGKILLLIKLSILKT